jgi:hypothetical protein
MLYIMMILLYCLGAILLYKTYQHHTRPKVTSYLWYRGPRIYGWDSKKVYHFEYANLNPEEWRSYYSYQINGAYNFPRLYGQTKTRSN